VTVEQIRELIGVIRKMVTMSGGKGNKTAANYFTATEASIKAKAKNDHKYKMLI